MIIIYYTQIKPPCFSIALKNTLDDKVFDFSLTFKTMVSDTWEAVRFGQNGKKQIIRPVNESGIKYVYYDAIPGKGNISIYAN